MLLLVALLLCSCTQHKQIVQELDSIYSQIQDDATLAQSRLDSLYLAHPESFTQPDLQARYILLDTYCKYKTDQEIDNDSLISIAEHYFLENGTAHDKMLCLFLHGFFLSESLNGEDVYPYYLRAAEFGEESEDHYFLGQIYSYLLYVCIEIHSIDKLRYADKALENYEKYGNPGYILDAKVNKAIALYYNDDYEKSETILQEIRPEAIELDENHILAKIDRYLASIAILNEQFDTALSLLVTIPQEANRQYRSRESDLIALTCAKLHKRKEALQYAAEANQKAKKGVRRKNHYKMISEMYHELGDDTSAYQALIQYMQSCDSIYGVRFSQSVSTLERDMEKEKYEKSETARRHQQYVIWLTIIMIILFSFASTCYIRKKRKEIKQLKEINELKTANEALLQEQIRINNERKQQAITLIRRSTTVADLQYAIDNQKTVQDKVWNELEDLFAKMLPSFMENLKKQINLNEQDTRMCMLQQLNFSNTEIGSLLCKTPNAICMKNRRLYEKIVEEVENPPKDWLCYIHSL